MLMGLGRWRRSLRIRAAARTSAGLGLVVILAGCQGVRVARTAATPNRPLAATLRTARSALAPATTAISLPPEMATIDPDHSEVGITTPVSGLDPNVAPASTTSTSKRPDVAPPEPTPLLDAALIKARNRGDLPTEPAPTPALAPAIPDPITVVGPTPPEPGPALVSLPTPPVAPPPAIAEPRPAEEKPLAPEDAWRDGIRRLVGLARARLDQGGGSPNEPWGLRARVLAWLAEPDIDPDLGQREADGVRSVLHALAATSSGAPSNAHLRGDEVRTAVRTLEAQAPLELVDLRLCQAVDGFGDFQAVDSSRLRPGSQVVIYVEVDGVQHEITPRGYRSKLVGRHEIASDDLASEKRGRSLTLPLPDAEEILERRRRDYYVNYLLDIPADLAPGSYTLRLTLEDAQTHQSASRAVPFRVVATSPASATEDQPSLAPGLPPGSAGHP